MIRTRNGDRLYIGEHARLAFLARHTYTNAWGRTCVSGSLFNLDTGVIQRDAVATCNIPVAESDIVHHALKEAGYG
jgi:hypothetical protein